MEVSGQLRALTTLSMGKETPVPIAQEAGWATELVWTWWWRGKIPFLARDEPWLSSHSLVTILTGLFWLWRNL